MAESLALAPAPGWKNPAIHSEEEEEEGKGQSTGWILGAGCVDSILRLYSLDVPAGKTGSSVTEVEEGKSEVMEKGKEEEEEMELRLLVALKGHKDWVKCLSFTQAPIDK